MQVSMWHANIELSAKWCRSCHVIIDTLTTKQTQKNGHALSLGDIFWFLILSCDGFIQFSVTKIMVHISLWWKNLNRNLRTFALEIDFSLLFCQQQCELKRFGEFFLDFFLSSFWYAKHYTCIIYAVHLQQTNIHHFPYFCTLTRYTPFCGWNAVLYKWHVCALFFFSSSRAIRYFLAEELIHFRAESCER